MLIFFLQTYGKDRKGRPGVNAVHVLPESGGIDRTMPILELGPTPVNATKVYVPIWWASISKN